MLRNNRWTRLGAAIALAASLLLVGVALAQGGTGVDVSPASASVAQGATTTIAINVSNVVSLSAYELHLQFDPNVLEVTQLAHGGFIAADFTTQNTFDNISGTIDYGVSQLGKPGVSGNGALLSITFRGKATGTSTIGYRTNVVAAPSGVLLADASGNGITTTLATGSVTVTGPAATPTVTPTVSVPTPTATATLGLAPTATVTPTLGPTPTRAPTATATPASTLPVLGNHLVKAGETLFCIGRAYVVSPWAIAQMNSVPWPYTIFPNQNLKIPNSPWINPPAGPICARQFGMPQPTPTPGPVPTATPTAHPPACRATYVVAWGDTLYRIALRFNSNIYVIAQANGISNINLIFAGQRLCIP